MRWVSVLLFTSVLLKAGIAEKTLDVYWVDVEGGGATLIVTPAGESVLVDTGIPGERDPGRIVRVAKDVAGLKQIDHLVVTHFHIDHFGGTADLAKLMPLVCLYDFGVPAHDPDGNARNEERFQQQIQAYQAAPVQKRIILKAGDLIPLRTPSGGVPLLLRCLASKQQLIASDPTKNKPNPLSSKNEIRAPDSSDNANSIALLLEYGPFRFFDGADLTWNIEGQMVCPVNRVGWVDVYQVDHHGFDVSNNRVLIQSLEPTISVMINGTQKGCGPQTVALLKSIPSIQANYQVHRNLRKDGADANTADDLIANLEANCKANYVKLSVSSDGKEYTVSIPGTGHQRTYRTRGGS